MAAIRLSTKHSRLDGRVSPFVYASEESVGAGLQALAITLEGYMALTG
jgi:hypothetical protein